MILIFPKYKTVIINKYVQIIFLTYVQNCDKITLYKILITLNVRTNKI